MSDKEIKNSKKRKGILIFLALVFIFTGLGYGAYYYLYSRFYESTDNAYVKQNIVYVTPQISGIVEEINVHETQYVKKGELLARLDNRDLKLSFQKAKATLASTVRAVSKLYKERELAYSSLKLTKIGLQKATDDLKRKKYLKKFKAVSQEVYQDYKYAYDKALQNQDIAKKKIDELNAILKTNKIYDNPQIKQASVLVEQSYLNLARSDILAPKDGIIAQKRLSSGEYVRLSSALFAIVPTNGFWVDANFKETQLRHIKIGQSVKLYSDIYGKSVEFSGKVEGINPGTGSVFSLLPAQNATGNWIKIVQRIPVRIKLKQEELLKHPLHVGNSMQVKVDIHNQKGDIYSRAKSKPKKSSLYMYKDAILKAKNIVSQIIKQNI
ncbi:MAG: HlyD family efflux transporter periplasmic adaptor subunit [Epsilonproteobacteria bacterium]|nr:HlyD family efflux transporter periplasmic adaptor subunit [Campylobacterota bacterium]